MNFNFQELLSLYIDNDPYWRNHTITEHKRMFDLFIGTERQILLIGRHDGWNRKRKRRFYERFLKQYRDVLNQNITRVSELTIKYSAELAFDIYRSDSKIQAKDPRFQNLINHSTFAYNRLNHPSYKVIMIVLQDLINDLEYHVSLTSFEDIVENVLSRLIKIMQ